MISSPMIFDRSTIRRHIARATPLFGNHSVLFEDSFAQIQDRISEVKSEFSYRLDLNPFPSSLFGIGTSSLLVDSEEIVSFVPQSFDLITSTLELHWINDVPGILTQVRALLKPEGMFIASLIGEQSLRELRECLIDAELFITGGISPRLSPTIDLQTASGLMQRAGFKLPVGDREAVTLLYKNMYALMHDLRGMGQTNAHTQRLRTFSRRAIFSEAARLYQERFADSGGHIPATFEIIYLHGWK